MEKLDIQRLKSSLQYLKSKQRELKRNPESQNRSIESIIKYLKKDIIDQFKLANYDIYINQEVKNTELFIDSVQKIIENNS